MDVYVGLGGHLYQPWWQFPNKLVEITDECYRPNLRQIVADPRFRMTLNVNYSLVEQWQRDNDNVMIDLINQLVEAEHVELTNTLGHHAFTPLINERQFRVQVGIQERFKRFTNGAKLGNGFYLPEFAFSPEVVPWVKQVQASWTVADDQAFYAMHGFVPYDFIPTIGGLGVFQRSYLWCYKRIADAYIDGRDLAYGLAQGLRSWTGGKSPVYIVIFMDFETWGHHIKNYWDYCIGRFVETINTETPFGVNLKLATLSEIYDRFPKQEFEVPKGSQSTSIDDWRAGNYFPLWRDLNRNKAGHEILWELVRIIDQLPHTAETEEMEAQVLASCAWWQLACNRADLTLIQVDAMIDLIRRRGSSELAYAHSLKREFDNLYFPMAIGA